MQLPDMKNSEPSVFKKDEKKVSGKYSGILFYSPSFVPKTYSPQKR